MPCERVAVPCGTAIVCSSPEADTAGLDMRTRSGQEELVRRQVRAHGGFTVFWATANQRRASAIMRLVGRGEIARGPQAPFPWCGYVMREENDEQTD